MRQLAFVVLAMFGMVLAQAQNNQRPPVPRIAGVSCSDFKTYQQAKVYFDYWSKQPAPRRSGLNLDRDNDGLPCECLPGGPDVGKPNCKSSG